MVDTYHLSNQRNNERSIHTVQRNTNKTSEEHWQQQLQKENSLSATISLLTRKTYENKTLLGGIISLTTILNNFTMLGPHIRETFKVTKCTRTRATSSIRGNETIKS